MHPDAQLNVGIGAQDEKCDPPKAAHPLEHTIHLLTYAKDRIEHQSRELEVLRAQVQVLNLLGHIVNGRGHHGYPGGVNCTAAPDDTWELAEHIERLKREKAGYEAAAAAHVTALNKAQEAQEAQEELQAVKAKLRSECWPNGPSSPRG